MQNILRFGWFILSNITIEGRISRKEFWNWFLFSTLVSIALFLLFQLPASIFNALGKHSDIVSVIGTIYLYIISFAQIIFSLWKSIADVTVSIRRFHDFGKSALVVLFYWIIAFVASFISAVVAFFALYHQLPETILIFTVTLIPFLVFGIFSLIYFFICLIKKGDEGENEFGLPKENVYL